MTNAQNEAPIVNAYTDTYKYLAHVLTLRLVFSVLDVTLVFTVRYFFVKVWSSCVCEGWGRGDEKV